MITKIKNLIKKLTIVEWVILGIAVLALVVGISKFSGNKHKGPHGEGKHGGEVAAEVVPVTK